MPIHTSTETDETITLEPGKPVPASFSLVLKEILGGGFAKHQIRIGSKPNSEETYSLMWTCDGDGYSNARWRVEAQVSIGNKGIAMQGARVFTYSRSTGLWTSYAGADFDRKLGRRLDCVLAVIGARETEGNSPLTAEERALVSPRRAIPAPEKAFVEESGRRGVLFDDRNGRGAMHYSPTTRRPQKNNSTLVLAGWKACLDSD